MTPKPSEPFYRGKTIVTIVGARPQFIKAAVVSRALRAAPGMREVLVHTGQHYDENMSAVFFEELEIPLPDYHLGIGSGPHGAQTGRMLEAIKGVLKHERPNWVLVYGDTNSTLAAATSSICWWHMSRRACARSTGGYHRGGLPGRRPEGAETECHY